MPAWLGMLTTHEIAAFLDSPRDDFGKHLADRLRGRAGFCRVDLAASLDTSNHRWVLQPNEVRALEDLRQQLDAWWNELPMDAHDAISGHNAGMVPGFYREAVEALGLDGAVPSGGLPLQYPFHLPKLILGYVKFLAAEGH